MSVTQGVVSAAIDYVERGWCVIPLASNGRSPLLDVAHVADGPASDSRQLAHWWQVWPYAAVGIATGRASGLVVVSVPRTPTGPPRRGEWRRGARDAGGARASGNDLPHTAVVRHATRLHYYYYVWPDTPIPTCDVGDMRIFGEAGVVVAPPPCIHAKSPEWEHAPWRIPVSSAPAWVRELAT